VNLRHIRYETARLLIGGGAIACACAALKVDFRQVEHRLRQLAAVGAGHANVQHPREITIGAGHELTIDGGVERITPIAPAEVARRLAWAGMCDIDGRLYFRGQSLEVVVAEFNGHNQRKLRVADPQTGHLLVGGSFRDDDLDGFVATLALTHGVRATRARPNGALGEEIILDGSH
jgi:ferric-dicitrate binding protein FerR (iron transport regulator)